MVLVHRFFVKILLAFKLKKPIVGVIENCVFVFSELHRFSLFEAAHWE